MDKHTREQRRINMRAVKSKGSKIETLLMKALWHKGYRYRKNVKTVLGKPDIAIKKFKIAVFCDSEFWHGKDWITKKYDIKSNKEFWYSKIERNIKRDQYVNKELHKQGWKVFRFWGEEIINNLDFCLDLIISEIEKAKKMKLLKKKSSGKNQIIKDVSFCTLLNNKVPSNTKKITEILKDFDKEIHKLDSKITNSALGNAHGDWYEWLLAILGWNFCFDNDTDAVPLLLPKINQFDLAELYIPSLKNLIFDLREKVEHSSNVKLITSNPDFVLIRKNLFDKYSKNPKKFKNITINKLNYLVDCHKVFKGKCNFDDILGYIGVKSSLRPDRRLQMAHEGSLMKALYAHLQTREWIIEPIGLKYYAISTKIENQDYQTLKTVATHSITTVSSLPQAAVDEVFEVNSINEANNAYKTILFVK